MTSVFEFTVSLGLMIAILAGGYMAVMYLGAVYHIKKEIKRKQKEDGDA